MGSPPLHLTVAFERDEEDWWLAQVPEVQGAVSQGRTREEARAMVLDALALALEARRATFFAAHADLATETLPLAG